MPVPTHDEPVARDRRPFQYRLRTLSLAILVLAVWLGLILDPNTGPLVLGMVLAVVAGVGVLLAAVLLGALGFGLFAVAGSAVRWCRGAGQWAEKEQGWDLTKDG